MTVLTDTNKCELQNFSIESTHFLFRKDKRMDESSRANSIVC